MTALSVTIDPAAVLSNVGLTSKAQALQMVATIAAQCYGLDQQSLHDRILEREKLGTTGFGGSVAIPHAKIESLRHCIGVVLRLENPIDYSAYDDRPVDLMFALFSPENSGTIHLKTLAEISRLLRDEVMVTKLRGANSNDAIYALLTGQRGQQAA